MWVHSLRLIAGEALKKLSTLDLKVWFLLFYSTTLNSPLVQIAGDNFLFISIRQILLEWSFAVTAAPLCFWSIKNFVST